MKKRIISLFMCLVMASSLPPTAAWAEPYFCPGIGGCTATWGFTPEEDGKYAVVTFHQHGYHGTGAQAV